MARRGENIRKRKDGRQVHQGAHTGGEDPVGLRLRNGLCGGQTGTNPEKSGGGVLQPESNRPDL